MSVKLRLKRMGRKKVPFFRLIAIDSRRQRDGLELERLGVYNPVPGEAVFNVNEERLFYWLEQGAEPSDTVHNLMRNNGLALKWHLMQEGASEEEIEREYQKWQLLRESKASAKSEQQKRAEEEVAKKAQQEASAKTAAEETVADEPAGEAKTSEDAESTDKAETSEETASVEEAPAAEDTTEDASAETEEEASDGVEDSSEEDEKEA